MSKEPTTIEEAAKTTEGINTRVKYPVRAVITLKRSGEKGPDGKPKGIKVSIPEDWHMQDTMASQRFGKGDGNRVQLGLIQRTCLFDGERWTVTDIETRITGRDWIQLQGEFFGDDDEDEDAEKNG